MADVTFTPAENLEADVAKLIASGDDAFGIAEEIARVARSNAPKDSGDYVAGIQVQRTKFGARVFAEDHKSSWIEFGVPSRNIPAQYILRRAVDALGLKFRKGKR